MTNILQKIETTESGLTLSFGAYGIFIPFKVIQPDWEKAAEIAAERGHKRPSLEQGAAIIENTDKINEAMKAAGKPEFDDWFWLDREHSTDPRFAWCVDMSNGHIHCYHKYRTNHVRAVSAFPLK